MDNAYLTNPIRIVVWNPSVGAAIAKYVCVGDVPDHVDRAISAVDKKVLRGFYGSDYEDKLFLGDMPARKKRGGAGGVGVNSDIGVSPEEILRAYDREYMRDPAIASTRGRSSADASTNTHTRVGGDDIEDLLAGKTAEEDLSAAVNYPRAVHIYPEDKLTELAEKIQLITKIPVYRQHLFWYEGDYRVSYKMLVDGIYPVDINHPTGKSVDGLTVDMYLVDNHERLRVECMDPFSLCRDVPTTTYYVVDLQTYLAPIRHKYSEIASDNYQLNLYYWGVVVKFWPKLTRDCFRLYLSGESELAEKYPSLVKSTGDLAQVYRQERQIIDHMYKIREKSSGVDLGVAITQLTAIYHGGVSVNIRNLFEKLRASRRVPEIRAYVERDGGNYLLRKKHVRNGTDIQFPPGVLLKQGLSVAISLRKRDQDTYQNKTTASTIENEQTKYLFWNIHANGRVHIRCVWNEEDELDFDDVLVLIRKFTGPIVDGINELARFVFTSRGKLGHPMRENLQFQNMNVCLFWRVVMLDRSYKIMRGLLDQYVTAGIFSQKLATSEKFELVFRKSIHQFDLNVVERTMLMSAGKVIDNFYLYLTDPLVKLKWEQNYAGRTVKFVHRTADVRVEIADIREDEFVIFYNYCQYIVYSISHNREFAASIAGTSTKDVRKLKKLREQDPELFNLKKHGNRKTYSILCQGDRQPIIYTDDEVNRMSAGEKAALTEYWNFTFNKPTFYGCPSKTYAHLAFLVGIHPKHYCLPCCNKKSQDISEKKRKIKNACVRSHEYTEKKSTESKHILAYGKDIDVGRITRLPTVLRNLLRGTSSMEYYVLGVQQNAGIANVGFAYAVAESVGLNIVELVEKIAKGISKIKFEYLLGGRIIDHFETVGHLVAAIEDVFVRRIPVWLGKFERWAELLAELFTGIMDLAVYVFVDEEGRGTGIKLFAGTGGTARVLLKKKNKYYPIVHGTPDKLTAEPTGELLGLLQRMSAGMVSRPGSLDLESILEGLKGIGECDGILVNRANLVYGARVKVARSTNTHIFVPVDYSKASSAIPTADELPMAPVAAVVEFINAYNKYLLMAGLPQIVVKGVADCGVVVTVGKTTAIFYCDTATAGTTMLPRVDLGYDPIAVNRDLIAGKPPKKIQGLAHALYKNNMYQLFLVEFVGYLENEKNVDLRGQILALDFKSVGKFRDGLRELLADYPLDQLQINDQVSNYYYGHKNLEQLLDKITHSHYTFDRVTLNRIRKLPREQLRDEIVRVGREITVQGSVGSFEFPNIYVACGGEAPVFEPGQSPAQTKDKPPKTLGFSHTVSAAPVAAGYCEGRKLVLERPLEELADILAYDMTNGLKLDGILSLDDTSVDFFRFTHWPTEQLIIYRLEKY